MTKEELLKLIAELFEEDLLELHIETMSRALGDPNLKALTVQVIAHIDGSAKVVAGATGYF